MVDIKIEGPWWVPVIVRLPEPGEWVLTWTEKRARNHDICQLVKSTHVAVFLDTEGRAQEPSHWMELKSVPHAEPVDMEALIREYSQGPSK